MKTAAKRAGIVKWRDVWVHTLRKTFKTVLRSPLQDGSNMDPSLQEYFMGHILPGSQDTYFDKSKIEELRSAYRKLDFSRTNPNIQALQQRIKELESKLRDIDNKQTGNIVKEPEKNH
ncbi:MAG: hypothetical protein ACPLY9_06290 [Nitrososphaerales archaeon]